MDNYKLIITDKIPDKTIRVKKGETLGYVAIINKGWEEKKTLTFHFEEKNATVHFLAIIIGKKEEKFPFETVSLHETPNTNAYYTIRSALFDKSEIDYKGSLNIRKEAQLTNSYLAHHTLMLSDKAKTHTVPCLEIEADDVKAGHAATIGQVDEDLVFYLKSRGIDKKEGQAMLIKGFLEAEIDKIPDKKAQNYIMNKIEEYL
ncbi:hypothetical protein HN709_02960 [Candidatus Peregrinibacteria bacterium]|jgi:Fe-S cluster assembly protein SufD|nr:hypothetical protein [Candidatus Peregrinibacteria bacterium]MBT7736624.1 hypothetical protein [Candidatus Peregrinibacteria bacterium]